MFKNQKFSVIYRWLVVIALVILAALTGAIAAFFMFNKSINYLNLNSGASTLPTDLASWAGNKKTVLEQDEHLILINKKVATYLFGVYQVDKNGVVVDWRKPIGQAVVLTNNGWLLARLKDGDKKYLATELLAVSNDYRGYKVSSLLYDKVSDFWLIKLENASSLSAAPWGGVRGLSFGQSITTIGWQAGSQLAQVEQKKYKTGVLSSDQLNFKLITSEIIRSDKFIITDLNGYVVAMINNKSEIIAMEALSAVITNALKNNKINYVWLGVNYTILPPILNKNQAVFGAKLTKTATEPAVIKGSPADKAGLKEGDIILAVDGVFLTEYNDLSDIIANYKAADKIYIRYKRGDVEKVEGMYLGLH